MNCNRKTGTGFERDLCVSLSGYGFWAHNLAQNRQGQPFDVIAAINGNSYVIDCKVCENDTFRLDRIEQNQETAMLSWEAAGNTPGYFALRLRNGSIYFFTLRSLLKYREELKSLSKERIESVGTPLDWWVKLACS